MTDKDLRERLDDLTEGVEGIPLKDLPQETQDAIKATVDNLLKGGSNNTGSIGIRIGNKDDDKK